MSEQLAPVSAPLVVPMQEVFGQPFDNTTSTGLVETPGPETRRHPAFPEVAATPNLEPVETKVVTAPKPRPSKKTTTAETK